MGATTTQLLTVEEYLSNPAYDRCEYVDGHAIEINVGTKKHARAQRRIAQILGNYSDAHRIGDVATELRCLIGNRFLLPDACVVLGDKSPDSDYLEHAPDLVVEVKSPTDTLAFVLRKMEEYLAAGTRLGWLILPEEESVLVFARGQEMHVKMRGEELDGADILPGLTIQVDRIFSR